MAKLKANLNNDLHLSKQETKSILKSLDAIEKGVQSIKSILKKKGFPSPTNQLDGDFVHRICKNIINTGETHD